MRLGIRAMQVSDIEAVYDIESTVHITPWSKDILRDCVLVGYDCRVLEIYDSKVPTCSGYIISRYSNNVCHILNFCIAKSLQGQGFGRKLLENFLSSLKKFKQLHSIILEVRPSNQKALHLYETLGFEQIEIKEGYYNDENAIEDAIVLKKNL